MPQRFNFDGQILSSVVGGKSAIDLPKLNIHSLNEAQSFIQGYGFDLDKKNDQDRLWYFYRRALVLITEKLGYSIELIPENLRDRKHLEDLRKLLVWASSSLPRDKELQKWSCAILRCIHVFVHAENDLFSSFSEEIQQQILAPFQKRIFHDGNTGGIFLKRSDQGPSESEPLALKGFDVKPFKTSTSTVIKLLAKPDALAMSVFDKIGVRFVTNSMFDSFRVVRYLVEENLISFPHIMPDQSSNNLYPANLFLKACAELVQSKLHLPPEQIENFFDTYLENNIEEAAFFRKTNNFSGANYRFIKFICRKLIRVQPLGASSATSSNESPSHQVGHFSFFYPFEVQIMDKSASDIIQSGPSDHGSYKERQKQAARMRLFP